MLQTVDTNMVELCESKFNAVLKSIEALMGQFHWQLQNDIKGLLLSLLDP